MRWCLLSLLLLPVVSGCEFVLAQDAVVTNWISKGGGAGIEVTQKGSSYEGRMFWLSNEGKRFTQVLCLGLHDRENNQLIFSLEYARGISVGMLREGRSQYVEFDLSELGGKRLIGKWRIGTRPPKYKRKFYPYSGYKSSGYKSSG